MQQYDNGRAADRRAWCDAIVGSATARYGFRNWPTGHPQSVRSRTRSRHRGPSRHGGTGASAAVLSSISKKSAQPSEEDEDQRADRCWRRPRSPPSSCCPPRRTAQGRAIRNSRSVSRPMRSTAFAATALDLGELARGAAGAVAATAWPRFLGASGRTRRRGPTARRTTSRRRARWRCRPASTPAARSSRARCCSTQLAAVPHAINR